MEGGEDSYDIDHLDGFENYEPQTEETPSVLVAFFAIYVCLSIILAIPITAWRQKNKEKEHFESGDDQVLNGEQEMVEVQQEHQQGQQHQHNHQLDHQKHHYHHHHDHHQQEGPAITAVGGAAEQPHGAVRRRPSMDPPGLKELAGLGEAAEPAAPLHHSAPPLTTPPILTPTLDNAPTPAGQQDGLSSVPSAASTSRLQTSSAAVRRDTPALKPIRSWDLGSRPWGRSRPLGRAALISRSIALERQSQLSEENASHGSRRSKISWMSGPPRGPRPHRTMSDAASHILDEGEVEGEAEYYRQKYVHRSRTRRRQMSVSTAGSLMPPLSPDVLAPEDAADAHDAGQVNRLEDFQQPDFFQSDRFGLCSPCCRGLGRLLELAESDYESRRILGQAVPSTIDAVADPLYRSVLLAIISHYIGTDSTTAFVLSIMFIRLTTEEISGAITDVETDLVKEALSTGGEQSFANAGRCVQLAIIMQILLGVPILIIWAFLMDELVLWLVSDAEIANLAASYTKVIIVDYIFRGITRAFMLPFHLSGRIQFERNIDVMATILTLTAVAVAASNTDDPDGPALKDIGWIQVIIGVAKTITKIFYLWMKGLLQPYFSGFTALVVCISVQSAFAQKNFANTCIPRLPEPIRYRVFSQKSDPFVRWFSSRTWRGKVVWCWLCTEILIRLNSNKITI